MLVLTVITWMIIGSWDKDPYTHRSESLVYRWYGFVFFFWIFLYGFWSIYMISKMTRRRTSEMAMDNYDYEMTGQRPILEKGIPRTAAEHELEFVQNTALHTKYVWFWIAMVWPMIKMSFDDNNDYPWFIVLMPLLAFVMHFFILAVQSRNYIGVDQRYINIMRAEDMQSVAHSNPRVNSIIRSIDDPADIDFSIRTNV